jgi:hypothetical protein
MTAIATISLDHESWDHKPSTVLQYGSEKDKYGKPKTETRVLGARVGVDVSEVNPKQLARAILRGQTWSPFVFNVCADWKRRRRVEGLFLSCQVLGVDFDSGDSVDDIMTRAEQLGVKFNILHHSFSSTAEHPKLRGIVFLEEVVENIETAKLLATGLAYALDGDKSCIDVARMYYGSTPESLIHLDNDTVTPIELLSRIAKSADADKYVVSKDTVPREYDENWGTLADQRQLWMNLAPAKREFVKRKVKGILDEIEAFNGARGASRYECVWRRTSRIARMPEMVGTVTKDWVMERIRKNPYFDDWDKDAEAIVSNAIAWSFEHSEPPV